MNCEKWIRKKKFSKFIFFYLYRYHLWQSTSRFITLDLRYFIIRYFMIEFYSCRKYGVFHNYVQGLGRILLKCGKQHLKKKSLYCVFQNNSNLFSGINIHIKTTNSQIRIFLSDKLRSATPPPLPSPNFWVTKCAKIFYVRYFSNDIPQISQIN